MADNGFQKVSEISVNDIMNYLRMSEISSDDRVFIQTLIESAKAFIAKYTGLEITDLDSSADFTTVLFVLVQDMFDNRSLYVDKSNLNNLVETILGMHSVNLL